MYPICFVCWEIATYEREIHKRKTAIELHVIIIGISVIPYCQFPRSRYETEFRLCSILLADNLPSVFTIFRLDFGTVPSFWQCYVFFFPFYFKKVCLKTCIFFLGLILTFTPNLLVVWITWMLNCFNVRSLLRIL